MLPSLATDTAHPVSGERDTPQQTRQPDRPARESPFCVASAAASRRGEPTTIESLGDAARAVANPHRVTEPSGAATSLTVVAHP